VAKVGYGHNKTGRERGATLVEFALLAPLLFLLLFGIIEGARLIGGFTGIWTAAREGARYATTLDDSTVTPGTPRYLDCAGIRATAKAKVGGLVSISDSQIGINYFDAVGTQVADCNTADSTYPDPPSASVGGGSTVHVTVEGSFQAVVPLLSSFLNNISLDSTQSRSIFMGVIGG
jgi:Flp pilus assembly protein TadG